MKSVKKNVILNVIKQICTIVFPLITFPYAVRIIGTENYGMFSFSSSIISYVSLIASLGVTNYAIREGARLRESKALNHFINEIFTINALATAVAYLALFLLLLVWQKLHSYTALILVLSLNILFNTLGTEWINSVFEDYQYITIRYIICSILSVILLFIIVRNENDVLAYAITTMVSTIGGNIANIFYIRKKLGITPKLRLTKATFRHVPIVIVMFANTIASTIYINSDITVLGIIKDDYCVGIYGAASKIYMIVKGVINAAIMVVIPRISFLIQKQDKEKIHDLLTKTLSGIVLLLSPAVVGLIMLAKDIVNILAGDQFLESEQPLIILSVSLIFAVLACYYINGILIPYRKEKIVATLTIISAVVNIILNIILIPFWGYNAAAITTVISELIMFSGGVYFSRSFAKISVKRDLLLSGICGVMVGVVCYAGKMLLSNDLVIGTMVLSCSLVRMISCVIVCGILYVLILYLAKDNIGYDTMKQMLKKLKR